MNVIWVTSTGGFFSELIAAMAVLFAATAAMFSALPHQWLVSSAIAQPYMDEEFHARQTQLYCDGNFTYWDPKITTPPGLYGVAVGSVLFNLLI